MPIEPPPSRFALPDADVVGDLEVAGVGADLAPGTLLDAYRRGLFPMRLHAGGPIGWWSPEPRGVIPLDGLHVSRSLRRSCRRYRVTVDQEFDGVVAGCADPSRPHGWIDHEFAQAYAELHRLGWAHSIEVWDTDDALVGGLYGVAIGGLFAAESKFHRATDASKVAVVGLVDVLRDDGDTNTRLLDVQWTTPHLASLGAVDVSRQEYGERVRRALTLPLPTLWTGIPDA